MSCNTEDDARCRQPRKCVYQCRDMAEATGSAQCDASSQQRLIVKLLLERRHKINAEMEIFKTLIRDKYDELADAQNSRLKKTDGNIDSSSVMTVVVDHADSNLMQILDSVAQTISELEEFTKADGLNENVVDEYVRHLERDYDGAVLVFSAELTQTIRIASNDILGQILASKRAKDREKILLVLKEAGYYSLLLYNASDASFYHYDTTAKRHREYAEQLVLKLRRYFDTEQLVEVQERANNSAPFSHEDSALSTVDNMMKMIVAADDENDSSSSSSPSPLQTDRSPVNLIHLPSHPDYLKIIVMSRFIVTKLTNIGNSISRCLRDEGVQMASHLPSRCK